MRCDIGALFAFCDLHASRVRSGGVTARVGYYDRAGFPIPSDGVEEPCLVWARLRMSDPLLANVAQSDFPDGSLLSTVWLGLDHGWGGRPLLFETMYFSHELKRGKTRPGSTEHYSYRPQLDFPDPFGDDGELTDQLRYTTEEEALAAHREIARRLCRRWEV